VALVAVGSAVIYLPAYFVWHDIHLLQLPIAELALQTIYQGILVTVVSLLLYGRAIAVLGAPAGAAFGALVPVLSALIAIPLLGDWPDHADWLAIALISAGVYLASGGPPPRIKRCPAQASGPRDRMAGAGAVWRASAHPRCRSHRCQR
jgi:drug/metabolite transporter (DMT)-like permease